MYESIQLIMSVYSIFEYRAKSLKKNSQSFALEY